MSRRRLSLQVKWTAALLGVGALPLCIFAYIGLRLQHDGLLKSAENLRVATASHVQTLVSETLRQAVEGTHQVGQLLTEGSIVSDEGRLRLAEEALGRAPVLSQVAIYNPEGRLIDAIRSGPAQPRPREQVPPGSSGWLTPTGGEAPVMAWAEPVLRDGRPRAIVVGHLPLLVLDQRLRELAQEVGESDSLLLLDQGGRVLAGGHLGADLGDAPLLRALRISPATFRHGLAQSAPYRDGKVAMLGTLRTLPERSWAVIARQREVLVLAPLWYFHRIFLLSGVSLVLLAGIAGALLGARTTRPIRRLAELVRGYGRREFSARPDLRTGDELQDLGETLGEMAGALQKSEAELLRRTRIESDLSRFLPAPVARSIASGEGHVVLGGQRRQVTVLFADVVAFTPFAESAPPERVVAFLNELFTVLTEVAFRHGGTVDKFIGDCMMVLFGAPDLQTDHARRALSAAEDLHRFVEASAPGWQVKYGLDVRLGIGVASGEAIVGNLGSECRMEYTAVGDMVNTAARLEGLARPGQTLVTAEVARLAGDEFTLATLGEHPLRGKHQTVTILEVI